MFILVSIILLSTIKICVCQDNGTVYGVEITEDRMPVNFRGFQIRNGYKTYNVYHPYIVSIQYESVHICSGTLIHPQWVVTAGTCLIILDAVKNEGVDIANPKNLKVFAGLDTLSKMDNHYVFSTVWGVFIHAKFITESLKKNIGLLKLTTPFKISSRVQTLEIKNDTSDDDHDNCYTLSWKRLADKRLHNFLHREPIPLDVNDYASVKLMKLKLKMINRTACESLLAVEDDLMYPPAVVNATPNRTDAFFRFKHGYLARYLWSDSICSQLINHDCPGDPGSPLICNEKLDGFASWALGCLLPNNTAVFVHLQHYMEWIEDHIRNNISAHSMFRIYENSCKIRNMAQGILSFIFLTLLFILRKGYFGFSF